MMVRSVAKLTAPLVRENDCYWRFIAIDSGGRASLEVDCDGKDQRRDDDDESEHRRESCRETPRRHEEDSQPDIDGDGITVMSPSSRCTDVSALIAPNLSKNSTCSSPLTGGEHEALIHQNTSNVSAWVVTESRVTNDCHI